MNALRALYYIAAVFGLVAVGIVGAQTLRHFFNVDTGWVG